ncbi:MAG: 1-aminocyclopropane-1-carboxylate deaminase/D-cysteine desulfhydrase [Bacteroidota bacterium]
MFTQSDTKYHSISYGDYGVTLMLKLLCWKDPILGGNKFYKLKNNRIQAQKLGIGHLVTVGGAYSNHLAATARAGRNYGFHTTGIVRGETIDNHTLKRAQLDGMRLVFVTRKVYMNRYQDGFAESVLERTPDWLFIPEGGANSLGLDGCAEILEPLDETFDLVAVCCGTGTTAAGMMRQLKEHQMLWGFSVLRDQGTLDKWIVNEPRAAIIREFDFGGYARKNDVLERYCHDFYMKHAIRIEPVYTGKMLFGIEKMIRDGRIARGTKVLAIHTGGLQYLEPD